ncbi:MAG: hypothetical protein QW491_13980 [Thermoproteota archaeon]
MLAGAVIGILHISLLTLLGGKRTYLFLLSGICIISPVASIYANRSWWINMPVDGTLGFSAVFKNPGIGLLIATLCAIGLIALGIKEGLSQ